MFIFSVTLTLEVMGQTIDVTLFDSLKNEVVPFANVQLLDSSGRAAKEKGTADLDGNYKFENVTPGVYSIRTHFIGYGEKIISNLNIRQDTSMRLNIRKYCEYDKSINDKYCPVCHQTDKVIPICYGLVIYEHGKPLTDSTGKVQKVKETNECYPAGCAITGCDPNWYCKRDKTKF
jgi:hypothetical protein